MTESRPAPANGIFTSASALILRFLDGGIFLDPPGWLHFGLRGWQKPGCLFFQDIDVILT
jgi:hypothetical protein